MGCEWFTVVGMRSVCRSVICYCRYVCGENVTSSIMKQTGKRVKGCLCLVCCCWCMYVV